MKDAGVGDPRLVSRSELASAARIAYPHLMKADSRTVASYVCAALNRIISCGQWVATLCPRRPSYARRGRGCGL